jgi:hypothetical protein
MKTTLALKIISGGQTGVDRAALEWALVNGVPHGGWCPKGRKAEDGIIPPQFQLKETGGENYSIGRAAMFEIPEVRSFSPAIRN